MMDPKPVRYLVTWTIDVWADNPYEAAMQAQHRQTPHDRKLLRG